jgi:hypothetical protein
MTAARPLPYVANPMDPDPREEKLPAWARGLISQLRRRAERAEGRAAEARLGSGPADTDTLLDPYDDTPIRLPKGSRVRFLLDATTPDAIDRDRLYVDVSVNRRYGKPLVELHSGKALLIRPVSSNLATAEVEER